MEAGKMMISSLVFSRDGDEGYDDVPLPGFRFHPTDEELVEFYLRRMIEKRPISIELIKQIDVYKYDPWDLPKGRNVGDKEWYFFCKRGRKYRNSVRPNRVTGSGFWKATGIDRPIYSSSTAGGENRDCVGLKKSLVYYRGSAGKGTKTEWMMHEFRLPDHDRSSKYLDTKTIAQDAEVWTLCRILKRTTTCKKCIPDWRKAYAKRNMIEANSQTRSSVESEDRRSYNYITFSDVPAVVEQNKKKPFATAGHVDNAKIQLGVGQFSSVVPPQAPSSIISSAASCSSFVSSTPDMNEFFLKQWDWEDLRSIAENGIS